jgi:hypothetical protein
VTNTLSYNGADLITAKKSYETWHRGPLKSKKSFTTLTLGRKVAARTGLSGSAQRSGQARPGRRLLHPGQHQPQRHP